MSISAIQGTASVQPVTKTSPATDKSVEKNTAEKSNSTTAGAVYEKSSQTKDTGYVKKNNSAVIKQLQADADARTAQLKGIVEKMMAQQGTAIGKADDGIWKFLASGDYTVSPEVKAQAQADIAEDGYWGVEQTSERILDFAKALSNNDPAKADEMLEAFKKGFKAATAAWGKDLPDISQRTYDAVLEKFDNWKNGDNKAADNTVKAAEQV